MCVSSLGSALAPPLSGGEGVAGRQGAGGPTGLCAGELPGCFQLLFLTHLRSCSCWCGLLSEEADSKKKKKDFPVVKW